MSNIEGEEDFVPLTAEGHIRERLIHVLHIYPGISPSMLQVGIGTAISPKMWHPVMDQLKAEGLVKETEVMAQAPNGRDLTHKKLSLIAQESLTGTKCSICGQPQVNTYHGITCPNGHGGAAPMLPDGGDSRSTTEY